MRLILLDTSANKYRNTIQLVVRFNHGSHNSTSTVEFDLEPDLKELKAAIDFFRECKRTETYDYKSLEYNKYKNIIPYNDDDDLSTVCSVEVCYYNDVGHRLGVNLVDNLVNGIEIYQRGANNIKLRAEYLEY